MIAGLRYLLDKHPNLRLEPRGLARIHGQVAFAHAAADGRRESRRWTGSPPRHDWRQRPEYLPLLVGTGLLRTEVALGDLYQFGRGS